VFCIVVAELATGMGSLIEAVNWFFFSLMNKQPASTSVARSARRVEAAA
jgi:hypothetical protein